MQRHAHPCHNIANHCHTSHFIHQLLHPQPSPIHPHLPCSRSLNLLRSCTQSDTAISSPLTPPSSALHTLHSAHSPSHLPRTSHHMLHCPYYHRLHSSGSPPRSHFHHTMPVLAPPPSLLPHLQPPTRLATTTLYPHSHTDWTTNTPYTTKSTPCFALPDTLTW